MITEAEINALELTKRVFEHFTHDSLAIAKEIIAMEYKLGQTHVCSEEINAANPILQVKNMDVNDFSKSALSATEAEDYNDPAQPVKQMNPELVYKMEDDLPF